ncbi:hypothetical protein DFJ58DRAFT_671601 [Suillus subalutaceus]|uniref:uncharacterized protein n=1 Tax=Suillus subalutaceus TaxID=48586 RepID=UPI001B85ED4E|nr:uncharacterized protein DFJ58DRAFT_671601 [Suillus subalutaceus]KAG1830487.1 hypothetical protein DFJ58DRAFT_671601 [Suillus subalutaceus]
MRIDYCIRKTHKCAVPFVNEILTLRRHQQAVHRAKYLKWAEKKKFKSMLPKDTKRRREELATDNQTNIDGHLKQDKVVQYSDVLFREAALEWLIETDQPIDALEHPAFKNMIDIAARSTNGIKIPNRRQT